MNSQRAAYFVGVWASLLFAVSAGAQAVPPFFSGAATSFEPQIGIVNSGIVLDVQPVVSHDLKYVTITMQPQSTRLLDLQAFTFQQGMAGGIVGLSQTPAPAAKRAQARGTVAHDALPTSAQEIKRQADSWVLAREGMYRVATAK